jgi:sigma-B regulation protein RsbU (phosphoserine phosphatase)
LAWLNEAVLHSHRDLFLTACYATLRAGDGVWDLTSTAAGHPLPIVATAMGSHFVGEPGTLLGAFPEIATTTGATQLHVGDVTVLYTDGITDLPPPYGIVPGELAELVHRLRDLHSADAIAAAINQSLVDRVPDRNRRDDVALLVVRII